MSQDSKKKSVLIIDDEEDILETMSMMVSSFNYNVIAAQTLPVALIKINNQTFNAIILDIQLKRVSGLKVIDQIRRNFMSMNHNTPILLHSGHLDTEIMDYYKTDIDDAIIKPTPCSIIKEKLSYWDSKRHTPPIHPDFHHKNVLRRFLKKSG